MRPEALRSLMEEAMEECRRYEEMKDIIQPDAPFPSWNNPSTTIIGIEGWEPIDNSNHQQRISSDKKGRINGDLTKEARRSLIIVSLGILLLLLLYASKVINEL